MPAMTPRQTRLVRESFPTIRERTETLVLLFYGRLFQLAPSVRSMFSGDLGIQMRKFRDMLGALVDALDDFDQQRPKLRAMGLRHVGYGVVPEHYDTLAAALLWALGHMLQPDFPPEVKSAWAAFIDEVSAAMKAGPAELSSD